MSLARDGFEVLPAPMPPEELAAIVAHLKGCKVYDAHVQAKAQRSAAWGAPWPMACHHMHDVLRAPGMLQWALSVRRLARGVFGEEPLLYSVNAMWTQPASHQYGQTHKWHRDGDDRKFLALFMYGSDVLRPEDGPHRYLAGSHLNDDPPQKDIEQRAVSIYGRAGTMFVTHPRGLHIGVRPGKLRLLLWARWGVSEPPISYVWDKLAPAPKASLPWWPESEEEQRAVRLVAA